METNTHLFSKLKVKSVELRNRIGIPPMCQYSCQEGLLNDWHLGHYGLRAAGGFGLIIIEATTVCPEGRITPGDAGIWSDAHIEPLARTVRFIESQGAVPGIQIAHAGRKASAALPWKGGAHLDNANGGWNIVAPSPIAFGGDLGKVPHELTIEEITRIQADFVAGARRALQAGCKWLEIHSAHGYLSHEFLSPLSNKRTDRYGGSFENRIRFLLETTQAIRAVWPEHLPFTIRLSCTDWVDGGWDLEQTVALCRILRQEGVDLIDCSTGGGVAQANIPVGPNFQVPFADRVRRDCGLLTAAVGLITEPAQADQIIRSGQADMVLIGRESLRDPNWPLRAARSLGCPEQMPPPPQYARVW